MNPFPSGGILIIEILPLFPKKLSNTKQNFKTENDRSHPLAKLNARSEGWPGRVARGDARWLPQHCLVTGNRTEHGANHARALRICPFPFPVIRKSPHLLLLPGCLFHKMLPLRALLAMRDSMFARCGVSWEIYSAWGT